MIISCPLHSGCEAWTGEERRDADGDYQWECMSGFIWWADETGDPGDDEECCPCDDHSCARDCDCCPEHGL